MRNEATQPISGRHKNRNVGKHDKVEALVNLKKGGHAKNRKTQTTSGRRENRSRLETIFGGEKTKVKLWSTWNKQLRPPFSRGNKETDELNHPLVDKKIKLDLQQSEQ